MDRDSVARIGCCELLVQFLFSEKKGRFRFGTSRHPCSLRARRYYSFGAERQQEINMPALCWHLPSGSFHVKPLDLVTPPIGARGLVGRDKVVV